MTYPIWIPSIDRVATANLTAFIAEINQRYGTDIDDYARLHAFSISDPGTFWSAVWDYCGIVGDKGEAPWVIDPHRMPGARWFPGARLNFAETMLKRRDDSVALVELREDDQRRELTAGSLYELVSRLAQAMRALGVRPGDRVAGYLPNMIETAAAMLAAISLGAIWTCCSPEYGVAAAVDRLAQVAPKLLIASDGYVFKGRRHAMIDRVSEIAAQLPDLEAVVMVPVLDFPFGDIEKAVGFDAFVAAFVPATIDFVRLPFDHPAFVLFSSGTTGAPKCIVHGGGGALLENIKAHVLQFDVKPGDVCYMAAASGWIVWLINLTALAAGASAILYDGSPSFPHADQLLRHTAQEGVTLARFPARYVDGLAKAGATPGRTHDLGALRTIMCNGSVFGADGYAYVHDQIKRDVHLISPAGGTDSCGSLVSCDPVGPVWPGEIQAPALGFDIRIFDPFGVPVAHGPGELVVVHAFPSIPTGFWNDPDGVRLRAAYFDHFPGVWRHGDWAEVTDHGGIVIHGRSDSTLNAGGVRIGSAELYRYLGGIATIQESVVVAQEWDGDTRIVLFLKLCPDTLLDERMKTALRTGIRDNVSPRHVPARIVAVADIPVTVTSKVSEAAVHAAIHGRTVANRDVLANPDALTLFAPDSLPELAI